MGRQIRKRGTVVQLGSQKGAVDLQGMDSEMVRTMRGYEDAPDTAKAQPVGNPISQVRSGLKNMGQSFKNLLGRTQATPAEDAQSKAVGEKAYWDAKYQRSLGKK